MASSALGDGRIAGAAAGGGGGVDSTASALPEKQDLRIAMIGNVDSGKSSLVGVLTRNMLDDGRGKARATVFKHAHEAENGRTSSVGTEIMGFAGEAVVSVDPKARRDQRWRTVHEKGDRRITLLDLAGHEKYLRTTIGALTGMHPDYCLTVVGANAGISRMSKEHIAIGSALKIPLIVVITRLDLAPPAVFKRTVQQVQKTLRAAKKMPYLVRKEDQVAKAAAGVYGGRLAPVCLTSNVTGQGLDVLRSLLRALQPRVSAGVIGPAVEKKSKAAAAGAVAGGGGGTKAEADSESKTEAGSAAAAGPSSGAGGGGGAAKTAEEAEGTAIAGGGGGTAVAADPGASAGAAAPPAAATRTAAASSAALRSTGPGMVLIDSVFNVPGVGTVVAGTVTQGEVDTSQTMLLGPDRVGGFTPVTIRSIHVHYTPVDKAHSGGSAAFAIRVKSKTAKEAKRPWIKRGMSLIHPSLKPVASWGFDAEIVILHHQTTISVGYAPTIHIGAVMQSTKVLAIYDRKTKKPMERLRTGDKAIVHCQFQYAPQFIAVGTPLLFREGRAKGVGKVTRLHREQADEGAIAEAIAAAGGTSGKAAAAASGGGGGT